MRIFPTVVVLTWLGLSVIGGVIGGQLVWHYWDTTQREQLWRIAAQLYVHLAGQVASSDQPVHRDRLEQYVQQFAVDRGATATLRPSDGQRPRRSSATPTVTCERAAAGKYLYRIEIPLPDASDGGETLEILLRVSPQSLLLQWWSVWLGINVLVTALAVSGWGLVRRRRNRQLAALDQWIERLRIFAAFQQNAASLLPDIAQGPDDVHLGELRNVLRTITVLFSEQLRELLVERERNRLVMSNLGEGVIAVDEHQRVFLINQAAARMLGESPESVEGGLLVASARIPELVELVESAIRSAAAAERELSLDNGSRPVHVTTWPLPLGNQRRGALITLRDITQQRKLEVIRRDFVANASHELKTPLAAIRAYAETLQLGTQRPEDHERFLGQIIEQVDRLDSLVRGMLQLARIEAGHRLDREELDLARQLQPCVTAAQTLCETKGIAWSDNLDQVKTKVWSNVEALCTIVNNLLSNAIRYTSPGGRVELVVQDTGNCIRIAVHDTGQGIAPSELERIFERFYRGAGHQAIGAAGTGLGLSIVKHLVQELKGHIEVESQPGVGSTFTVTLPKQPENAPSAIGPHSFIKS